MYFSSFLGPTGRGPMDDLPLIDFCTELALACDDAGFAIITLGDQHFANYEPYGSPFTMMASLAAQMKTAYLGSTVVQMNLYHPFRFNQYCNIIDLMTRGKCLFGISAGAAVPILMASFGLPDANPKEVFNKKLEVALRAWDRKMGDPVETYETPYEKGMMPPRIMPISYRNPHPMLALGTNTDATIEDSAKRGWPVYLGRYTIEEGIHKMGVYRKALHAAGHSAEKIQECLNFSSVTKSVLVAETDDKAWELAEKHLRGYMNFLLNISRRHGIKGEEIPEDSRSMREMFEDRSGEAPNIDRGVKVPKHWVQCETMVGSVETIKKQLKQYEDGGVNHVNFRFVYGDFAPDETWRNFNLFANEVMPAMNAQTLPPPRPEQIREEHKMPNELEFTRTRKHYRGR